MKEINVLLMNLMLSFCKLMLIFCYFVSGFFTNHSLRATCATRMFRSGVDEQLICQRTGHRSSAVRAYKRPCEDQMRAISNVIQGKRPCVATSTVSVNPDKEEVTSKTTLPVRPMCTALSIDCIGPTPPEVHRRL